MALAAKGNSDDARGVAATCEQDVAATSLMAHLTETAGDRPERLPVGAAGLVIVSISAGLWWLIARLVW